MEPFAKLLDERSLVIAVSQSGETADTLIAAKAAKSRHAHLVAVVNARSSTLERLADTTLSVGSGPEIGVVSTKAFTAQVVTLAKLIATVQGNTLESSVQIKQWLTEKLLVDIQDVAAQLMQTQDIYVIGKHEYYPVALETALKIKESSYIHAEGFAAGELKHGVISLIQKDTPCIVMTGSGLHTSEILSSATELKTRGGLIIGIAPHRATEYDIHIPTLEGNILGLLSGAIVGQLLGYYLAIGRGLDPDKPRNLAKSVTVK
jgi:glucosamine--fructose-6-phosphate aminotransferase (isomerizing)